MSIGTPAFPSLGFLGRLGSYLWRRMEPARTFPGLLAFSVLAVASSAHLSGREMPGLAVFSLAFLLTVVTYMQLVVFQDIRDTLLTPSTALREPHHDRLVRVATKVAVGGLSLALTLSVVLAYDPSVLGANGVVWVWLGLVLSGYFVPDLMRRMPALCVVGHMAGAPAAGFLLGALEWGPTGRGMPEGLWTVLLMFFANACVIDIGERIAARSRAARSKGTRFSPEGLYAPVGMMVAAALVAYASFVAYGSHLGLGVRFAEIGGLVSIPFVCGLVGLKVYPSHVMEATTTTWSRAWMVICYALAALVPLVA